MIVKIVCNTVQLVTQALTNCSRFTVRLYDADVQDLPCIFTRVYSNSRAADISFIYLWWQHYQHPGHGRLPSQQQVFLSHLILRPDFSFAVKGNYHTLATVLWQSVLEVAADSSSDEYKLFITSVG
jgi:hypothetical protein